MPVYELAQLNIARMLAPLDAPEMADFVANLDRINALAEFAPGFVWRLQDEQGNATTLRPFGADMLVNMSVWTNLEQLSDYVYKSAHVEIMKQRKKWFERMAEASTVLWWVPQGHRPDAAEGMQRLQSLRALGPSEKGFGFKQTFGAPQ